MKRLLIPLFGLVLYSICGYAQDNRPRYAQLKSIEVTSLSSATNLLNAAKGKLVMSDGSGAIVWKLLSELPSESGILPVANGGTGSTSQNFVDLTTSQTVAGAKTWSNLGIFNTGLTSTGAVLNLNASSNFDTNINTGTSTGTVNIGTGTGVQTLNFGTGGTGAKTINIGTGAIGNSITVGNITGSTSVNLLSGSGNLNITAPSLLFQTGIANADRLILLPQQTTKTATYTGTLTSEDLTANVVWTLPASGGNLLASTAIGGFPKANALLLGSGTSAISSLDLGTSGQVLTSGGASAAPAWASTVTMAGDVSINNTGVSTVSGILGKPISGTPASGNILKYDVPTTSWILSDPTTLYTFTNALTASSGTVKLGGALSGATTITLGDFDLNFNASGTTTGSGSFNVNCGLGNFVVRSSGGTSKFQLGSDGAAYLSNYFLISKYLKIGSSTPTNITTLGDGDLYVSDGAEIGGDLWVDGTFRTPSDQRLKTKIQTLENVLDKINRLRTVSFEFIDQKKYAKGPQIGVIAQELRTEFPELVYQGAGGYLSVDYTHLTAVFIQAVKEQQVQIAGLQEKVKEQETRLDEQQKQIEEIKKLLHK